MHNLSTPQTTEAPLVPNRGLLRPVAALVPGSLPSGNRNQCDRCQPLIPQTPNHHHRKDNTMTDWNPTLGKRIAPAWQAIQALLTGDPTADRDDLEFVARHAGTKLSPKTCTNLVDDLLRHGYVTQVDGWFRLAAAPDAPDTTNQQPTQDPAPTVRRALTTRVNQAEARLEAWRQWGQDHGYGLGPEGRYDDDEPVTSPAPVAGGADRQAKWAESIDEATQQQGVGVFETPVVQAATRAVMALADAEVEAATADLRAEILSLHGRLADWERTFNEVWARDQRHRKQLDAALATVRNLERQLAEADALRKMVEFARDCWRDDVAPMLDQMGDKTGAAAARVICQELDITLAVAGATLKAAPKETPK